MILSRSRIIPRWEWGHLESCMRLGAPWGGDGDAGHGMGTRGRDGDPGQGWGPRAGMLSGAAIGITAQGGAGRDGGPTGDQHKTTLDAV